MTVLLAPDPQPPAVPLAQQFKAPVTALEARAQELATIRTLQELEEAGRVLVDGVRPLERKIKESYERIKAPARETLRNAAAEEAEQLRPVLAAKATLDAAIKDYARRQREARERLAARELAAADERGEEPPPRPAPVARAAGVSMRVHYVFEMIAAGALKPEYLVADEGKIRKIVSALGDAAVAAVSQPGMGAAIRVFRADIIASSRRGGL